MITGEDILRLEEEAQEAKKIEEEILKKLLILDTGQFFEIEVPHQLDIDLFLESDTCLKICAEKIISGITEIRLEKIKTLNENGEYE